MLSMAVWLTALAHTLAPLNPVMGPEVLCLPTLILAVSTEGLIALVVALIRKKPVGRLLIASAVGNCITVSALTIMSFFAGLVHSTWGLILFLVAAEIAIWLFEAFFMHRYPGTQLNLREALSLSLIMNLGSIAAGYGVVALLVSFSTAA